MARAACRERDESVCGGRRWPHCVSALKWTTRQQSSRWIRRESLLLHAEEAEGENEHADGSARQSDQVNAGETDETSDANTRLAQQNDAETALLQNELSEMLGEHQMVLDELGGNQGEFAGAAPASMEKGTADMTALQLPVGDPAQTQGTANGRGKNELNQPPVWRPSRMDFRKK